ncbi:MAG: multidrug efflux SMR transporter [Sporocytophaga sp.]|uniref:DMT family transporter n=1 Tax=Sporocytophaga sp. TaxID=2231183 RepID=UPI001B127906|nr:multidrug efflux SMR transporter [Sporocytophaga sp.]MBO9700020.1 multidrug efflux SMR transporter [Sporocytophaga sp.]
MNWIYLSLAIVTEVVGTVMIRFSNSFSKIIPTILMIAFYIISYYFFNLSIKKIELGTAYAVWSGVGTALLTAVGMLVFNESISLSRVIAIALILIGVLILNLSGSSSQA